MYFNCSYQIDQNCWDESHFRIFPHAEQISSNSFDHKVNTNSVGFTVLYKKWQPQRGPFTTHKRWTFNYFSFFLAKKVIRENIKNMNKQWKYLLLISRSFRLIQGWAFINLKIVKKVLIWKKNNSYLEFFF